MNTLKAISPIDGRYYKQISQLSEYFSEYAYIKARVFVEIEYFIALCEIPLPQLKNFPKENFEKIRNIHQYFTEADAERIKEIEKITNHDVKAVEYFLKEKFDTLQISDSKEFIHFGLTSQDINNTAVPYLIKKFHEEIFIKKIEEVKTNILENAQRWGLKSMLAHTHGQPASPTTMGKEWYVFYERIENQLKELETIPFCGKFGGATGNFNAHHIGYPEIDWVDFGNNFLKNKLNIKRLQTTTQIEHYDQLAAYFDAIKRINNILTDMDRDIWNYISMEYFKQKVNENEVGSSAMPHKVNPIDFENSEGNIAIANMLLEGLSAKLPISRLQRDLTDSTVIRNIGVPLAHSLIAYNSFLRGSKKLILNEVKLYDDLENNWAIVSEGIQTVLRREGYPNPYEALKKLTRGKGHITHEIIATFIEELDITESIKEELRNITPHNYIGIMPQACKSEQK